MDALNIAAQTRLPTLIWGLPGIGKSRYIESLGRSLDWHTEIVLASIRDPSDFGGLPILADDAESNGVKLAPPAWAKRLAANGSGLLFIDEISTAAPAVQAALLRVVLDRVVGELELPATVSVVAAANPPEHAAGGWELSPPLANRFIHLDWDVDASRWVDGMLNGWSDPTIPPLPDTWTDYIPGQRTLVAGFIRCRPDLLLDMPDNEHDAGKAWPSPRSWDMAAQAMAAAKAYGASDGIVVELVTGCVGPGPALELINYLDQLDLPDPEHLLAHPSTFKLPNRGDHQFSVLASIVSACVQDLTSDRWIAAWTILSQAADQGAPDIAASACRSLMKNMTPDLPLPEKQVQAFIPILVDAGIVNVNRR